MAFFFPVMSVAQCRQAPAVFSKNCDRLLVTTIPREFLADKAVAPVQIAVVMCIIWHLSL
jgi:hypothetical protein